MIEPTRVGDRGGAKGGPYGVLCAVWIGAAVFSCGSSAQSLVCGGGEVSALHQELNGGGAEPEYVAMSSDDARAIVTVTSRGAVATATCVGAVVAPGWVLSAAHCQVAPDADFEVTVRGPASTEPSRVAVERRLAHPSLDLMLLEVPGVSSVPPLSIARALPSNLTNQIVQLTGVSPGHGADESSVISYAVERVVRLTEDVFTVTADGYAGTCVGDSGGPALSRSATGAVEILGVLSGGARSCWGEDDYVRADVARGWIEEVVGPLDDRTWSCGDLTAVGRCFGEVAVWCEPTRGTSGEARGELCVQGTQCGWQPELGFRCVTPAEDPCRGVTDLGDCVSGDAIRCVDGVVRRNACSACSATCVRLPTRGVATCTL